MFFITGYTNNKNFLQGVYPVTPSTASNLIQKKLYQYIQRSFQKNTNMPAALKIVLFVILPTFIYSFPSPSSPRESEDSLDGITHLARAADKAEMQSEQRLPMDLVYPCPKDQTLFSLLQIDSNEFSNMVATSSDDSELTHKLKAHNSQAYTIAQSSNSRFSSNRLIKQNHLHKKRGATDADGC